MNMKRCSLLVLPLLVLGGSVQAQSMSGSPDTVVMNSAMSVSMSRNVRTTDMRAKNAQMLIQTLSEEKTEINSLAAQQAQFRKLGGAENNRIARLWGVWIREHKAAGPRLMQLIRQNGGDPNQARILKAPPLGEKMKMLHVTHMDHDAAVRTSQVRFGQTNSAAIKNAMRKRANLARKHMRQMTPFHNEKNCPMCAAMMKNGKMNHSMGKSHR